MAGVPLAVDHHPVSAYDLTYRSQYDLTCRSVSASLCSSELRSPG